MSLADDATEREQRLKSALWYTVGQYVDDSLLSDSLNATPQFIGALTELVYTQIAIAANTAHDLETFAAHAGRRAINTDDVMLLTRRNEALEEMLKGELERMKEAEGRGPVGAAAAAAAGKAGRGRGAGRGAGRGKGKRRT